MKKEIIPIFKTTIENDEVDTVNARDLHEFLEVKTKFSDWIKRRITEYGFVENMDFTVLTKKHVDIITFSPIEYHITFGMAKELAMVERNEKGREARTYFIECERKLKRITPPPPQIADTVEGRAACAFEAGFRVAKLLGIPEHYAAIESVKFTNDRTGVDFSEMLKKSPLLDNIPATEKMIEPTELGKVFGCSGRAMNQILAEAGLQFKTSLGWRATEKGMPLCAEHNWHKGNKQGYNLKWNVEDVKNALKG